jgi:hypothetical protein
MSDLPGGRRPAGAGAKDGKIHKPAGACSILDLLHRQVVCGDNQARPTVIDSRSRAWLEKAKAFPHLAYDSDFLSAIPLMKGRYFTRNPKRGVGGNGKNCSGLE